MAELDRPAGTVNEALDSQTSALRVIATLLLIGAAYAGAELLVPFVLALILSIALAPVSGWLERHGIFRTLAAVTCTLAVAAAIAGAFGLIAYEAGTILQDSDRYLKKFGGMIDDVEQKVHKQQDLGSSVSGAKNETAEDRERPDRPAKSDATQTRSGEDSDPVARRETAGSNDGTSRAEGGRPPRAGTPGHGQAVLRRNLDRLGNWAVSGVGGALGIVGQAVVFLAFLLYMLKGRDQWMDSLTAAARRMGLRPAPGQIEKVQSEVVRYIGCLTVVASAYAVIVSLVLWKVGVPQPVLWGLLAGMLEVIPYFGPLVASVLPTIVALSLGSWWPPVAVAGTFLTLHLVEGNLIAPVFYGKAVKLDPVTILFGAIFFGGLWGPAGLAIATPAMIVLRGLLMITPDTPALDALADVKSEKAAVVHGAAGARDGG